MKKVRYGIVGLGSMGASHVKMIVEDRNKDFCVGAVCDIVEDKAIAVAKQYSLPHFTDAQKMFESGLIDAVLIAVPHYAHPPLVIRAARAGLQVLCEKPLAVTVGNARAMIAECKKQKVVLGAMLQHRGRGVMMKMKQMVDSGKVGEMFRISMICSNWYRTQFYYDSGAWRGTWDGEGGGVLLNQAPHSLDLFQWIGGMPKRVLAMVGTRQHKIEVENVANVICDYGKGKTGYIYATTAESPGMEQLMVCGDKGTLIAEGGKLRFGKLQMPISKHSMTAKVGFKSPQCDWEDVTWKKDFGCNHIYITRTFAAHLLRGTPLVASGAEAINELELSNAIYLAGFGGKTVDLPVDAAEIEKLIAKLDKERSSGKGGGLRTAMAKEMKKLLKA